MKRALLLAFCLLACGKGSGCDHDRRADAMLLVGRVDQFRRADNATKPSLVDAIRTTPCNEDDICAARTACLAFAEPTAKALVTKHEVEVSLGAIEHGTLAKDTPEAQSLPSKVDAAEALLKEGQSKLDACDSLLLDLKRTYRL